MSKKGKVYAVGIGPGNIEHMTIKAYNTIKDSEVIVGYKTYIDLIKSLIHDKEIISYGMKSEKERCKKAVDLARQGKIVSIISSGDVGIYGMAGLLLEVADQNKSTKTMEIEIVPGVTASVAAAASIGAPIMHDYVSISLSDLLTDWEVIEKRVEMAARGDFVICLYNPKSKGRQRQIEIAHDTLLKHKSEETVVAIATNVKRQNEKITITTLKDMLKHSIDMFTTVIIGNSKTHMSVDDQFMVTPRGYKI
ncbi:precorrin-3B C(17)-methyltransferase [Proteinivorax tanatarense]|uniref:Precorrin-3B C(17)-methyltransferase n=1 Tax=Proteinivorax tanatarense TaxID=1260629 RepID=A0AAU7VK73_9FIRM